MDKSVEGKIKSILVKCLGEDLKLDGLNSGDSFQNLGLNSILFIKVIVEIENEFGIEFDENDLSVNNFSNLESLIDYVEKKLQP